MYESFFALIDLLSTNQPIAQGSLEEQEIVEQLRQLQAAVKNNDNDTLLRTISFYTKSEILRVYAAHTLNVDELEEKQLTQLEQFLMTEKSVEVRLAILKAISKSTNIKTLSILFKTLIQTREPQIRFATILAISDNKSVQDWQLKVKNLLDVLNKSNLYRWNLELTSLIAAIQPDSSVLNENPHAFTDWLIHISSDYASDKRVSSILGGLILGSVAGNSSRAQFRLSEYISVNKLSPDHFDFLKTELEDTSLSEIKRQLLFRKNEDLLEKANVLIDQTWQNATNEALGVIRFMKMSVSFFYLVSISIIVFGVVAISRSETQLGVFTGLLGLGILVIAFLRFKSANNARQVLADVGVANAVYSGYKQRLYILVSTTLLHLLNESPDMKLAEKTNRLIRDLVNETVKELRTDRGAILEDIFK